MLDLDDQLRLIGGRPSSARPPIARLERRVRTLQRRRAATLLSATAVVLLLGFGLLVTVHETTESSLTVAGPGSTRPEPTNGPPTPTTESEVPPLDAQLTVGWLPPGYRLVSDHRSVDPDRKTNVRNLIYVSTPPADQLEVAVERRPSNSRQWTMLTRSPNDPKTDRTVTELPAHVPGGRIWAFNGQGEAGIATSRVVVYEVDDATAVAVESWTQPTEVLIRIAESVDLHLPECFPPSGNRSDDPCLDGQSPPNGRQIGRGSPETMTTRKNPNR